MGWSDPDELDTAAISAAYERRVAAVAADQVQFAMRLLERLEPRQWRLEWHLPLWLGNAFGLDRRVATEIAATNVLGLASLRLRDDLIDGDLDPGEVAVAPAMSEALFEASIDAYRSRFAPSSELWQQLDLRMAEWKATIEDNGDPGAGGAASAGIDDPFGDLGRLASRGAPLKVSAFAVCLLTGKRAAFPTVERCLDHTLAAMVLYDHARDWESDLAAGRWNAFVAATGSSQRHEDRRRSRSNVLAAMMAGNAIEAAFARIHAELEQAVMACDRVGVPALSTHLTSLAVQLDREGTLLQAHYGELGDHAAAIMFGYHGVAGRGMLSGTTP